MKLLLAVLAVLACVAVICHPAHAAPKPNFIVINIDDMGYADIGPFGSKLNRTPHLAGTPDAKPAHETFFYYNGLRLNAVRHGGWKLQIAMGRNAEVDAKDFAPQLYNLRADIGEATNAAAAHPEIVAKLQALIATMKDDLGTEDIGPGCRELGRVENPKPLLSHDEK